MIKTQEDFFNKIFTSHFIARVRKGCVGFYCERELETEHNWNILTPKVMAVSVVSFLFSRAAQPEHWSPLCWMLAFLTTCRLSLSPSLLACPPSVQFVGLILPLNSHAVIWTRLRNFFRYLAIGMCHFHYFWNGQCDRHRAEITVMQFRGHSLPVRQSMRV